VARELIRVLGGYCRGTGVDRSTWRVLPMLWGGHVRLTTDLFFKGVSPFPRAFAKTSLVRIFFNKDIEMSYDMLYQHENLSTNLL
jgi:hypothetical protein